MKAHFLKALILALALPCIAQASPQGQCVPRQDPLLDGFCGRLPEKNACESYPMCVWKEKAPYNTSSLSQDVKVQRD